MNKPSHKQVVNQAADLVRAKLNSLYSHEPDAKREIQEATQAMPRSKHQQYMYNLSRSGRSLADIQVAWHKYYEGLNNTEKHEVWQEFYDEHNRQQQPKTVVSRQTEESPPGPQTVGKLHQKILQDVRKQARAPKNHHLRSLGFGLACGMLAIVFLLFGFFNERFIAPFVTPSKAVSNTQIIIDPDDTKVGLEPKVVIPKINVEIPVVYDEPSIEEDAVQKALERGVVHYATTSSPGERGNAVIFGHSSNNIFNSGDFKFAFVLLKRLEVGDTFMLHKDGVRYVYRVFDKKIVSPDEVDILNSIPGKSATATLVTCDPPGTTLKRLVVHGEQISPSPKTNKASTAVQSSIQPTELPSNSPSLWSRLTDWL